MDFIKSNRFKAVTHCPCGKSNKDGKFVPFKIGGTPSTKFGYCHSCGKTFLPSDKQQIDKINREACHNELIIKSVPLLEMTSTLNNYHKNNFALWLTDNFNDKSKNALDTYRVGTSYYLRTIFWYIDKKGNIRNAKSMMYNSKTGKRIKDKPIYFLYKNHEGYTPCLFGEHLLQYYSNSKEIMLVESEKTAIIGSMFFPEYIWLATGGANSLTTSKAQSIQYRKVIYIPDCDEAGNNAISQITSILKSVNARFYILNYFNKNFKNGEDIVDILFTNNKII